MMFILVFFYISIFKNDVYISFFLMRFGTLAEEPSW